MKLFLKHLFRSIEKRPAQPLILIFTLALALTISVLALSVEEALAEEAEIHQTEKYGSADLTVSLNGFSESRFMFTKRAEELLGERASVAGLYELPMLFDGGATAVFAAATDFREIGNVFSLHFTEYGKITGSTLEDTALISAELAKERELKVGDSITVTLLGGERTYRVGAISLYPFAADYDVLVDISGVIRLLGSDSPVISALGEDFRPCSTVYVDVAEGYSLDECREILSADTDFADNTFKNVTDAVKESSNTEIMSYVVDVSVLLTAILSAAVTFCCFYILSVERTEENSIFVAAGASPRLMNLMQYLEIGVYWAAGCAVGTGLIFPALWFADQITGLVYTSITPSFIGILKSGAFLLLAAFATVTLFILSRGSRPRLRGKMATWLYFIPPSSTLAIFAVAFSVGSKAMFAISIIAAVSVLATAFICIPKVICTVAGLLGKASDKRPGGGKKHSSAPLRYAIKNLFSVRHLHNFARLTALLTAITLCSAVVILAAHGFKRVSASIFSADIAVINATEGCHEAVSACKSAERVDKVLLDMAEKTDGVSIFAISVSDTAVLSELLPIEAAPEGNRAIVSSDQARLFSLKVGDPYTVIMDGESIELEVAEISDLGISAVIFDCEHFGIPSNMLAVKAAEGYSEQELLLELADVTASELAAIAPISSLLETRINVINVYLSAANLMLCAIVLFSLIGMLDNLSQSYRTRRQEFELYALCGMTRGDIRRMKSAEIAFASAFGILLGILCAAVCAIAINRAMIAYNFDMLKSCGKLFIR